MLNGCRIVYWHRQLYFGSQVMSQLGLLSRLPPETRSVAPWIRGWTD